MTRSLAADLCAFARRCLRRSEQEFAAAVTEGDWERAGEVTGEAAELAAALKQQERAGNQSAGPDFSGGTVGGMP
jgi:hypothetical protein